MILNFFNLFDLIRCKYYSYLDIWMPFITGPKLTTAPLLFPMLVELWAPHDGHASALITEGESCTVMELLLVLSAAWQDNRD